jgi:hypothetical protein
MMDSRRKGFVSAGGRTAETNEWREFPNSVALIYAQSRLALADATTIGQGMAVAIGIIIASL